MERQQCEVSGTGRTSASQMRERMMDAVPVEEVPVRPEVREEACIRDRIAGIEKTLMCCLGISEDVARKVGTGFENADVEKYVRCGGISSYLDSIEQIACNVRVILDQIRSGL